MFPGIPSDVLSRIQQTAGRSIPGIPGVRPTYGMAQPIRLPGLSDGSAPRVRLVSSKPTNTDYGTPLAGLANVNPGIQVIQSAIISI